MTNSEEAPINDRRSRVKLWAIIVSLLMGISSFKMIVDGINVGFEGYDGHTYYSIIIQCLGSISFALIGFKNSIYYKRRTK